MIMDEFEQNPADERIEDSDIYGREILIIGCGNLLVGDDGFGPAVIKILSGSKLPENAAIIDAGTAIRTILFNIVLAEKKPKKIIIIDAVDKPGHKAGEVFEISVDNIPSNKAEDFAVHHLPTTNMLADINKLPDTQVRVIAAQIENIPSEMKAGLSKPLIAAVQKAADMVLKEIF